MIGACDHRPSANPRYSTTCVKCGRPMPGLPARDREFERQATRELCSGLSIDVEALIVYAERRADSGEANYKRDFPDLSRNLRDEALQELADARNYIVWALDAIRRDLDDEQWRTEPLQEALPLIAMAFEKVREAL
jgi:hypothetical protein